MTEEQLSTFLLDLRHHSKSKKQQSKETCERPLKRDTLTEGFVQYLIEIETIREWPIFSQLTGWSAIKNTE